MGLHMHKNKTKMNHDDNATTAEVQSESPEFTN